MQSTTPQELAGFVNAIADELHVRSNDYAQIWLRVSGVVHATVLERVPTNLSHTISRPGLPAPSRSRRRWRPRPLVHESVGVAGAICDALICRFTVELGGKSAAVILVEADMELAAATLANAECLLSGQVSAPPTRITVPPSRHDAFIEALAAAFSGKRVGDPFNPAPRWRRRSRRASATKWSVTSPGELKSARSS